MEKPPTLDHNEVKSIYKSCSKQVYSMVLKNSGTLDDAKDIFQETMIALFENKKAGRYQPTANICTYLYRIAYFKWMKELKKHGKEITETVEEVPDEPDNGVENESEMSEREKALRKCMDKIDEASRKMLRLYADGMKDKEAAQLLGIDSDSYYRIALMRAKKKLIECMKKKEQ